MRSGRECHIFYFGDYDPAGMCISDSIEERVNRYTAEGDVAFTHAGLSARDIEKYSLPTRPSKKSGPGAESSCYIDLPQPLTSPPSAT